MDISGWEIDIEALYGRDLDQRTKFHLRERLYSPAGSDWAVLLFYIGEIGVNKQVAKLALFREKRSPRLVYDSGKTLFWFEGAPEDEVRFTPDGRGARVFEFIDNGRAGHSWRERLLDFASGGLAPLSLS